MRLAVVIPCRGEAAVIERKIANLARVKWPEASSAHRVIVIDDGSSDGTSEVARAAIERHFLRRVDVEALVAPNDVRPGKPGAIRAGLARAGGCDLIALTDADVIFEDEALASIAAAFEREPRLALACGTQRFVRDVADDGTCRARDFGPLVDAGGLFDRATASVRALESRFGDLFSVHGQLLAWRADLGLAPAFGVAADDIDLRFQVKARASDPRRVEIVAGAVFIEPKIPMGFGRAEQASRRARAWFQALDRGPIPARGLFERAQALFYRHAPRWTPLGSFAIAPIAALIAALLGWHVAAIAIALAALAVFASPLGRRWIDLCRIISAASRAQRAAPLADAWETSRT